MENENEKPKDGDECEGDFPIVCQNCDWVAAYPQFVFSEGRWELYGYQCKVCWRTYYLDGGYSY